MRPELIRTDFAETGINFQLQASQDNTARQLLDVIEQVHKETPFTRQRMIFAHLEDPTAETLERINRDHIKRTRSKT